MVTGSEGGWCFEMKNKHPDWVIEGVDDTNRWSCDDANADLRFEIASRVLKQY
jgi:hypothetical protein